MEDLIPEMSEDLIPEMSEGLHSGIGAVTFSSGLDLMMILDVTPG